MRRRKPSYRHARCGAGNVIESGRVAESDGLRLAAVLATDADDEIAACAAPLVDGELHQAPHALDVERLERIFGQYSRLHILRQKLILGVFARERERRLREIVRAEREEFSHFRELRSAQARTDHFDHAAKLEAQRDAGCGFNVPAHPLDDRLDAP